MRTRFDDNTGCGVLMAGLGLLLLCMGLEQCTVAYYRGKLRIACIEKTGSPERCAAAFPYQ